jgi:hypothetical protein
MATVTTRDPRTGHTRVLHANGSGFIPAQWPTPRASRQGFLSFTLGVPPGRTQTNHGVIVHA